MAMRRVALRIVAFVQSLIKRWFMSVNQSQNSLTTAYNNSGSNGGLINPFLPTSQAQFQFWAKPVYQASDGTYWAPGFDGPTFSTNPWDYIKVGTVYGPYTGGAPPDRTPGICRIRLRKEYQVDKKKPIGANGSRNTFHGVDPAEFDIEIEIWTPEQLRQLSTMWAYMFPPAAKGTPIAFDVQHPLFAIHDVKSIQFAAGEGPEIRPDRRGVFRIRAVEFLKPTTANATKTAVQPIGSLYDPATPATPGANPANLAPR